MPISPDHRCECFACRLFGWQPIIFGTSRRALHLFRWSNRLEPCECHDRETIERVTKRFPNQLDSIEGANRGEYGC